MEAKQKSEAQMLADRCKPGHLAKSGPLVLEPRRHGPFKGSESAKRNREAKKLQPVVLNWGRKE